MVKLLVSNGADVSLVNVSPIPEEIRKILYGSSSSGAKSKYREKIKNIFDAERGDSKTLYEIYRKASKCAEKFSFDLIEVNESTLPSACFDILMYSEEPVAEYLQEGENFIFAVSPGSHENLKNVDMLCLDINFISQIIRNPYDNFFYECVGTEGKEEPEHWSNVYVKVPMNKEGFVGLIPLCQILKLLQDNKKIYYIVPALDRNGEEKIATLTASFRNSFARKPNYVSGNHCQKGTNMLIFDIKVCGGDNCGS